MAKPKPKNIIVTCAVTGSTLTPSMSPYLPVTAEQMITQSVDAVKAGASILHFHARNPDDGSPTNDPKVWDSFIPAIRDQCDAVINFSCSMGATAEERLSAAMVLRPEIATVIVGSMNYGRFKKAHDQGVSEFKHEWEREFYGPKSYHIVTANTFHKIDRMIDICLEQNMLMEFECYDVGHLYILDYHLQRKPTMHKPIIVQFLTGILGGIPSSIEHLLHMKQTAENLFGSDMELFIHGTGPQNMKAATFGAMMGTNLRIGQEDNLQERPGRLFTSNAEQVTKIVRIMEEFDIKIATPEEARQRLGLPHPAPKVARLA
ncbi:3-keto-5-aminohexanoate cleavage protein [Acidisphaera sp. L21]|uniref:3-keto-5-aminohexanoate cleavage protein n=1 Tax=Acidisphaera sp. L21 TaxID=1641851 RepID=UPI00131EAB56|nr:3-keto-5-aminohexanoate cleavage protein [Acidisphaera sp. L21]